MAYAEENTSKDLPKDTTNREKLESYMIEAEDVEGIRVATIGSVASSELTAKIGKQHCRSHGDHSKLTSNESS